MTRRCTRALVTLDLPPLQDGGIATLTDVLATGMHEIGEPVVVYARGRRRECAHWDAGRPYEVVRMRGHSWVRHAARNFAPYVAHILARRPPAHLYLVNWQLGSAATRMARLPVSILVHGLDVTSHEALPTPLRHADRVLTTTDWMRGELLARGLDESRIAVATPAVHPPSGAGDPTDLSARLRLGAGPILLSVGRLVPRKGQDTLIRALPAIRRRDAAVQLVIVGQGPDRSRLEELARAEGVLDCVRFAGFLDPHDLEAAYRLADLFVLPCREESGGDTEGFGLVFVEAGARGLPVIGGCSAGVVEAVEDGRTGTLVEPGDAAALSNAVLALLADPQRAAVLGEAGRRRALGALSPAAYARRILEAGP